MRGRGRGRVVGGDALRVVFACGGTFLILLLRRPSALHLHGKVFWHFGEGIKGALLKVNRKHQ